MMEGFNVAASGLTHSSPSDLTDLSESRRFQEMIHCNINQSQQTSCHYVSDLPIVFRATMCRCASCGQPLEVTGYFGV